MKRKTLLTLMIVAISIIVFGTLSASAATSGYYTYTIKNGEATITACDKTISGNVTIPSSLGGCPVTAIGNDVFHNCPNLTGIVIPDTVISIDTNSIWGCTSLKSITLGKNLKEVEDNVFCNLYALETIYWNAKNLTYLIGDNDDNYVFDGAGKSGNGITIIFGDSVESIPEDAFTPDDESMKISKIIMGKNIKKIGYSAFPSNKSYSVYIDNLENYFSIDFASSSAYPTNGANKLYVNNVLVTEITIPNGVKKISTGLMQYNTSITRINIPDSVTVIEANAFSKSSQLKEINVSIGNNYYSSINGVLFNKEKTAIILMPDRESITEYVIPEGVDTIKTNAFQGCKSIKTITIPGTMKIIEDYAFSGCSNLSRIYFNGTKAEYSVINKGSYSWSNTELNNATKIYNFVVVKVYNLNNELLKETTQQINTSVDVTGIIGNGYICNAYSDVKGNTPYMLNTPVTRDISVYLDLEKKIKPNSLNIMGGQVLNIGTENVLMSLCFATDKDVNALYCFIKYPDTLNLKSVVAKDFDYAESEDEYTEDGFTTVVILAQYSETELIPKNAIHTPFELTFDISKSAEPGTAQIEATEESCLIGNDTYFFEESIPGTLEILPKLAEGIEISGADMISSETTYNAIISPDYTTDKSVEWSVDNEEVATVDEDGVVTPVTSGTFILTATAKDGSGVTASKTITVTRGVTNIEISGADSITEATAYSVIITPDYATNKEVEWSISNSEIATIDQNGLVTPITSGIVTITATAKDGSGISVSKEINIIKLAESIVITGEYSISSPAQYTAIVLPDYTSDKEVSWSVDSQEIATVDELGILTPVTSGTVTLTANAKDGSGVVARKTIEIVKFAESIEIVGSEEITEPSQYSVVILPEYTTNKEAGWSVSDETVATVDENGVVTPLKNGKIVLTAKALDASGIETTKSIVITVSVRANSITSDVGTWDKEFDSDTTEYTINVPAGTTAIYLTSSFTNATAKVNGTIAANGVRKKVALTGTETNVEILLTPTSGNDLKANTYTINIVCGSFTKTTISEDKKSFTITPINIENGKTVILALYNGEQFVEMQSAVYTGEAVPFTTTKTYTNAKIMVWDDITNLKPVCNVEEIN